MHRVAPLALAVALAGAGATCSSGKQPAPVVVAMAGQVVPTSKLLTIAGGICDAARQASTDTHAAYQTFFGQSHDGIHLIAQGLQVNDRDDAASLLEATVKVEEDFFKPNPAPQLAADLTRLAAVTRTSLAHFKVHADACPSS
jgi:hypothetical protein